MNREQKRAFVKSATKRGTSKSVAKAYAEILSHGFTANSAAQDIQNGDKVKLDIEKIKARVNYNVMNQKYKDFVEESADKVFTARVKNNLVVLEENNQWMFWSGDLIKVGE